MLSATFERFALARALATTAASWISLARRNFGWHFLALVYGSGNVLLLWSDRSSFLQGSIFQTVSHVWFLRFQRWYIIWTSACSSWFVTVFWRLNRLTRRNDTWWSNRHWSWRCSVDFVESGALRCPFWWLCKIGIEIKRGSLIVLDDVHEAITFGSIRMRCHFRCARSLSLDLYVSGANRIKWSNTWFLIFCCSIPLFRLKHTKLVHSCSWCQKMIPADHFVLSRTSWMWIGPVTDFFA